MQTSNENGKTKAIVVIVVVLLLGMGGGYLIGHKKTTSSTSHSDAVAPSAVTKAANLRSSLVRLGVEHMILTDHAVDAALDGSANASAVGTALYTNGTDIGAAVGSVYGTEAETTFNSVWKLHLDEFVKYAVAGSKSDSAGKQAALDSISTGYTKPLAQYLAKANPNIKEDILEASLAEHVSMTAMMIDDHVSGDFAAEASELKMANQHIEGIFSSLADGIVTQYPEKF